MICECMRLKLNTVMHLLNKDISKYSIPSNNTLLVNPLTEAVVCLQVVIKENQYRLKSTLR